MDRLHTRKSLTEKTNKKCVKGEECYFSNRLGKHTFITESKCIYSLELRVCNKPVPEVEEYRLKLSQTCKSSPDMLFITNIILAVTGQ